MASVYVLFCVSVTELIVEVVSPHPTATDEFDDCSMLGPAFPCIKPGGGGAPVEIVYTPLANVLLLRPLAAAIALIVVVVFTGIGEVYTDDESVGTVTSVV